MSHKLLKDEKYKVENVIRSVLVDLFTKSDFPNGWFTIESFEYDENTVDLRKKLYVDVNISTKNGVKFTPRFKFLYELESLGVYRKYLWSPKKEHFRECIDLDSYSVLSQEKFKEQYLKSLFDVIAKVARNKIKDHELNFRYDDGEIKVQPVGCVLHSEISDELTKTLIDDEWINTLRDLINDLIESSKKLYKARVDGTDIYSFTEFTREGDFLRGTSNSSGEVSEFRIKNAVTIYKKVEESEDSEEPSDKGDSE